ncbi:hypothetical protein [Brachybacterium tyrofermentans]|uniref:hypothetical protein n=1 Tax=Brachybacterium tyrofermentans TaxID=47848 RepID=UPI0018674616|nr:hypothetical protein [Brachybacterium tyrofermentans]
MDERPSVHDPAVRDPTARDSAAPADDETARAVVGPRSDVEEDAEEDSEENAEDEGTEGDVEKPFGAQEPTRFASDVEYRGRADGHDYLVRVRHRLLDSSFTVVIDGVEHDPAAEEKARKAALKAHQKSAQEDEKEAAAQEAERSAQQDAEEETGTDVDPRSEADARADADTDADSGSDAGSDALQFRLEESFTVVRCTVRRRVMDDDDAADERDDAADGDGAQTGADGDDGRGDEDDREVPGFTDAEVISVHTAGLGGAGEVDVRHGLDKTLLVPAEDSPSAVRDEKRIAHPVRYAMLSALAKAAGFLIPLLGVGGLFSGLFDPVQEWVEARVRPVVDAISEATEPVRTWFGELVRPVVEFFDALFAPIRSAIAAVLRPIGEAWNWLTDLLFGWIPDFSLPFSVPEWVVDAALPVIVVLIAFLVTFGSLRHRREKLDATRAATQAHAGKTADDDGPVEVGDTADGTVTAGARATEDGGRTPCTAGASTQETTSTRESMQENTQDTAQENGADRGDPTPSDRSSTEPARPQR